MPSMSRAYNLISIKKCQFFLIFKLFLLLPCTATANKWEERKSFVCGYKAVVEYMNSLIIRDRDITLYQIEKLQKGEITAEEVIELTVALMRYRLLPIDETKKKCRFFSYLCIQDNPANATDIIYELAIQYLQRNPHGPNTCHIYSHGRRRQFPLISENCTMAIEKRIRAIPAPLAAAQAGLESAWGTSRFSIQGHNFFGMQTTFSSSTKTKNNPQCTPARRNPKRCVYKFNSIESSFFIYALLLNSYSSYISLREWRYQSELAGATPCNTSMEMARGLNKYAEDPSYVKKIQGTIEKVCQIINDC